MKTLKLPITNGTFSASDVTVSGTNDSTTHNVYVAFTQADSGYVAIQYKVSGSNNWQPMGKVDLTDTEVATFKVSGIITDWRFVVANASGAGSIEVTDSEKLEDIHPLSFYGETGGMSPDEIGDAITSTGMYEAFKAISDSLRDGVTPVTISVLGDSTGNETDEWVYLLGSKLAEMYPAYSVTHRLYSETADSYILPEFISTGSNGRRSVATGGGTNCHFQIDDAPSNRIAGDQSALMLVSFDEGFPLSVSSVDLCGKFGGAGDRGWRIVITQSGFMRLSWSTDGTNLIEKTSTVALPDLDGSFYIGFSLDVDNGSGGNDVKFYTSIDGVNLTQLGATVTTAGTTSVFQSTAFVSLGGRSAAVYWPISGDMYSFRYCSSLDMTNAVIDFDAGMYDGIQSTTVDAAGASVRVTLNPSEYTGSPELTIMNASVPGKTAAYPLDAGRQDKIMSKPGSVCYVSYSYNNADAPVTSFLPDIKTLIGAVESKSEDTTLCLVIQPPMKSPISERFILAHSLRGSALKGYASKNRIPIVDAKSAFVLYGDYESLIDADGIHPNADGSLIWYESALSPYRAKKI